MKEKALKLLIAIVVCEGAGILGSFFTSPSIPTWYASLIKPPFNPPNWLFAPVWTLLFLMMAVSAFLIWNRGLQQGKIKAALAVFGIQLLLNVLWSILFFGFLSPLSALIEIIFLWLAILFTIILFFRIDRLAGWLLIPYILWVSFASVLNFFIWYLN